MAIDRKNRMSVLQGNLYFEYAFNPVLNLDFQWLAYSSDLGVLTDERYWAGEPSDEHNGDTYRTLVTASLQLSDEQEWQFLYTYTTNQLDVLDNAWGINGRYFERVHAFDCTFEQRAKSGTFSQLLGFEFGSPQLPSQGIPIIAIAFRLIPCFLRLFGSFDPLTRVQLGARYSSYNHSYQSGWTGNLGVFRRLASF